MPESPLTERLDSVTRRIEQAARRANRDPNEITLIAVTKVFPAAAIREAFEAGVRHFGENYVQEFEGKAPLVAGLAGARFHLIGHLQSNKSKKAAELFHAIDAVDSPKLVRRLGESGRPLDVMVEVKLSPEEAKHGADAGELDDLLAEIARSPNLTLTGLMTMPPWSANPEESRPYFRRLRELASVHGISGLSMGMSHDLEVAIEEGATYVRVGRALFGERKRA